MSTWRMQTAGSCAARCLLALGTALFVAHCGATEISQQQQQIVSPEYVEPPYLLVTSSFNIYRMQLNSTQPQLHILVTESGISAVAFHYRLGYIFWINSREHCIKRANMDGTDITPLVMGDVYNPADLAVDWIHDKLYWSDSDLKRIEEIDLHTQERRTVVQLDENSNPLGLAVYPMENHGMLYWTDNGVNNLQRIITTGSSHAVVHQNLDCIRPIALNLRQKMVYWTNQCTYSIESVFINGSNHEFVVQSDPVAVRFPRGMSQFEDSVYWVQPSKVYMKTGTVMTMLYRSRSSTVLQDVQVVHRDSQPTIEQLQEPYQGSGLYAGCGNGCQNGGNCVFPGICECPNGWAGLTCEEDVNECQKNNGGCTHICINTDGGFHCTCPEGYTVTQNGLNCTEVDVTPSSSIVVISETSTPPSPFPSPSPSLEPKPTNQPTTPSSQPTSTTTTTTSTTDTESPTTNSILTDGPFTNDDLETVPTTSDDDTIPVQPTTTTTDPPNPSSTPSDNIETTTETSKDNSDASTSSSTSATKSTENQTPLPTSGPDSDNIEKPTLSGINQANDEGSSAIVIAIPAAVVAGFVLIALAVFLVTMTYVHCRNHRQGSYSFANPAVLEIASEVSTNTIKRGQVTRTSFRQIGSTPNVPETMAILSQPRDTRSSSTMSGSESFEWSNEREP